MKKMPAFLSVVLMLSGCGIAPTFDECVGSGITPINITYVQQNNMVKVQVAPNRAMVDPGDTIRFKIIGNLGKVVKVEGKASDPPSIWISGQATSGYFFVCVPSDVMPGQTYRYEVDIADIGFLDPEVRVRN